MPAVHAVQAVRFGLLIVPASQSVQLLAAAAEYWPIAHRVQDGSVEP